VADGVHAGVDADEPTGAELPRDTVRIPFEGEQLPPSDVAVLSRRQAREGEVSFVRHTHKSDHALGFRPPVPFRGLSYALRA
jgi:hypothetical protein